MTAVERRGRTGAVARQSWAAKHQRRLRAGGRRLNPSQAFKVFHGGRWMDTVFFSGSFTVDDVRRSLIHHDGYPSDIVVRKARARRFSNPRKYIDDSDLSSEMESGAVISQSVRSLYSRYSLAFNGRRVREFSSFEEAASAAVNIMDQQQYWPNMFFVNDHGNVSLLGFKVVKGHVKTRELQSWV